MSKQLTKVELTECLFDALKASSLTAEQFCNQFLRGDAGNESKKRPRLAKLVANEGKFYVLAGVPQFADEIKIQPVSRTDDVKEWSTLGYVQKVRPVEAFPAYEIEFSRSMSSSYATDIVTKMMKKASDKPYNIAMMEFSLGASPACSNAQLPDVVATFMKRWSNSASTKKDDDPFQFRSDTASKPKHIVVDMLTQHFNEIADVFKQRCPEGGELIMDKCVQMVDNAILHVGEIPVFATYDTNTKQFQKDMAIVLTGMPSKKTIPESNDDALLSEDDEDEDDYFTRGGSIPPVSPGPSISRRNSLDISSGATTTSTTTSTTATTAVFSPSKEIIVSSTEVPQTSQSVTVHTAADESDDEKIFKGHMKDKKTIITSADLFKFGISKKERLNAYNPKFVRRTTFAPVFVIGKTNYAIEDPDKAPIDINQSERMKNFEYDPDRLSDFSLAPSDDKRLFGIDPTKQKEVSDWELMVNAKLGYVKMRDGEKYAGGNVYNIKGDEIDKVAVAEAASMLASEDAQGTVLALTSMFVIDKASYDILYSKATSLRKSLHSVPTQQQCQAQLLLTVHRNVFEVYLSQLNNLWQRENMSVEHIAAVMWLLYFTQLPVFNLKLLEMLYSEVTNSKSRLLYRIHPIVQTFHEDLNQSLEIFLPKEAFDVPDLKTTNEDTMSLHQLIRKLFADIRVGVQEQMNEGLSQQKLPRCIMDDDA